jgi:hypothetical protein
MEGGGRQYLSCSNRLCFIIIGIVIARGVREVKGNCQSDQCNKHASNSNEKKASAPVVVNYREEECG